jgi:hypothetical protein
LNAEEMDALKERVLEARIRFLQARFELAIKQRDHFAEKYHAVTKTPFQERNEIIRDCDEEIESVISPKTVGTND